MDRSEGFPHVTDILKDAGLIDATWFSEEGRNFGTAVHSAIQFLLDDDLDEDALDPAVGLRVTSFKKFLLESGGFVKVTSEEHVEDAIIGYQGTLDIRGRFYQNDVFGNSIIDLKNGQPQPWHAIQLAAYAHTFDERVRRFGLYLSDTGYKLIEYRDRNDWKVFCAALTIANFKRGS
jgi:hypothetical protein